MKELTEDIIDLINKNQMNWLNISADYKLDEKFIRKYQDKVYWYYICKFQELTENFIIEFKDKVTWSQIFSNQKISENFIKENEDKVTHYYLIGNKFLKTYGEEMQNFILQKSIEYIDSSRFHSPQTLFYHNNMTEYMRNQYKKYWNKKCHNMKTLPSDFNIDQYTDWQSLCIDYNLSEDFIRKYQDKVDWNEISLRKILSEGFIIEFKEKLSFSSLIRHSEEYSKDMQSFMLSEIVDDIVGCENYYFTYMTSYMKEQFQKMSFML